METIRFKKRGGFHLWFEEKGPSVGRKVARLKSSSSEEDFKYGSTEAINSSSSNPDISSMAKTNASPCKELTGTLVREEGHVYSLAVSGDLLYTGSDSKNIRVWMKQKALSGFNRMGRRSGLWHRHSDAISCLCFNEDKTLLYSSFGIKHSKFGEFRIGNAWNLFELMMMRLTPLLQGVMALALNPDGTLVYCGSSDGLINFWDCENNLSHGGGLRGHKLAVLSLVTAGNLVISGSADKSIPVWKRCGNEHSLLTTLTGHNGPIKCSAVEDDHESTSDENQWILYSGSLDKSVKIWQLTDQTLPTQCLNETNSSN
ncbi:hypothetical protein F3Y22_tig00110813pilonHSYRG00120 [Hibiscus syriacus]|uniref:Uncharacterized protein n=1 Tax=Hibiscus syriacus TaxID=106335 RepID=A0A6A2ZQ93_HIBSY|nr:hypothetical protein F3Y22_tig00110813pilonHSYRG00120 [Hibiscus syriacus]